jgi:hypothetical protein
MKTIDEWLTLYGRDHQNPVNKLIHWICVPVILFTVFGLLMAIPFPEVANGWVNPATIVFFSSLDILFKAIVSNFYRYGAYWIFLFMGKSLFVNHNIAFYWIEFMAVLTYRFHHSLDIPIYWS